MASIFLKDQRKPLSPIARGRRFMSGWAMFFRQFVKHPGMIGSVIPSSPMLVDAILDDVDWARTRLFVEYGPGVGTFTHSILDRLPADATLLAIDLNHDFITYLGAEIADPRLRAVHGSAADVRRLVAETGHQHADYVLSGLPFSTLPKGVGEGICAETQAVLRPGGQFLIYQYSRFVHRLIAPLFGRVDERIEWLNIPPCRFFRAVKNEALAQAA